MSNNMLWILAAFLLIGIWLNISTNFYAFTGGVFETIAVILLFFAVKNVNASGKIHTFTPPKSDNPFNKQKKNPFRLD